MASLRQMSEISAIYDRWQVTREIEKYEFYDLTKQYPIQAITDVTGIPRAVIRDRRRYLRQLSKGV